VPCTDSKEWLIQKSRRFYQRIAAHAIKRLQSTLALFMARVATDNPDHATASDHLAIAAQRLD
jgi:hypothetical protein